MERSQYLALFAACTTYWADLRIGWVHRLSKSECVLVCIDLVHQSVCWVQRLTGQGKSERAGCSMTGNISLC